MKVLKLAVTGIGATAVMSGYMRLTSYFSGKEMKVINILGTLLTNQTRPDGQLSDSKISKSVGTITHFSIGILFTFIYHLLWQKGIGKPDTKNGLLLGFVSGLVGVAAWRTYLHLHPNTPRIPLKSYLLNLMLAHEVFALTAKGIYKNIYPVSSTNKQS
jgi:hypothetical protein